MLLPRPAFEREDSAKADLVQRLAGLDTETTRSRGTSKSSALVPARNGQLMVARNAGEARHARKVQSHAQVYAANRFKTKIGFVHNVRRPRVTGKLAKPSSVSVTKTLQGSTPSIALFTSPTPQDTSSASLMALCRFLKHFGRYKRVDTPSLADFACNFEAQGFCISYCIRVGS